MNMQRQQKKPGDSGNASAEEDEIEIEPEEVIEGSDSMDFTGGEGGVSLVDEADPDIEPYATADEFGEIAADVKRRLRLLRKISASEISIKKNLNLKTILVCWSFIRKRFTMKRMVNGKTLITL